MNKTLIYRDYCFQYLGDMRAGPEWYKKLLAQEWVTFSSVKGATWIKIKQSEYARPGDWIIMVDDDHYQVLTEYQFKSYYEVIDGH